MARFSTAPLTLAAALLVATAWVHVARAQTSGANGTHDPSRIIESNGKFYFCSTGGGCASSTDGLVWRNAGFRIPIPAWATTYEPGGNQGVWAPDIVFFGDRYHIYYSFCGVPAANAPCAIGLYTTPTLDPSSPMFKLTDAGMVVNNPMNDATYQFSTIDPAPIVDPSGKLWMSWGSGYGKDQSKTQLWLTSLDTTGLPLTGDGAYMPPAVLGYALEPGRREGSYVHYHGGAYFLFWNEGSCCSGTASTYTIWVARSTAGITGPYGGAKVFYAGGGNVHGPGHLGIYSACGVERFTYHYYPTAASVLGENDLSWGSDGWPVAGPGSTTPLVPCGDPGTGGAGVDAGTAGASGNDGGGNGAGGSRGGAGIGGMGTGGVGVGAGAGGNAGHAGAADASADAVQGTAGGPGNGGQRGADASGSSGCACTAAPHATSNAPLAAVLLPSFACALPTRRRTRPQPPPDDRRPTRC